jgi:hypothetical protein
MEGKGREGKERKRESTVVGIIYRRGLGGAFGIKNRRRRAWKTDKHIESIVE